MMLIRVEHTTEYVYSEPLVASTQYLRLTPLSGRTQVVESWKVTTPGAVLHQWYDQYGNCCHTLTVAQPVTELAIKVSGLVRTRDTAARSASLRATSAATCRTAQATRRMPRATPGPTPTWKISVG